MQEKIKIPKIRKKKINESEDQVMKSKQEVLGLIANIALVVLLFCFIVAGLNIIGIYSLPAPIEKLLGTYDDSKGTVVGDDNILYNSVSFDESGKAFERIVIGYEDAEALLSEVTAVTNYSQSVEVTRFYGSKQKKEYLNIRFTDGLYSVDFLTVGGKQLKNITEKSDSVVITEYADGKSSFAEVEKGGFDIAEECGFVLSVSDFLNSDYNLTEADFLMSETENGVFVTINFFSDDFGIAQNYKYVVSLDFGVVTEVSCTENGSIVYEMKTSSITF